MRTISTSPARAHPTAIGTMSLLPEGFVGVGDAVVGVSWGQGNLSAIRCVSVNKYVFSNTKDRMPFANV